MNLYFQFCLTIALKLIKVLLVKLAAMPATFVMVLKFLMDFHENGCSLIMNLT